MFLIKYIGLIYAIITHLKYLLNIFGIGILYKCNNPAVIAYRILLIPFIIILIDIVLMYVNNLTVLTPILIDRLATALDRQLPYGD